MLEKIAEITGFAYQPEDEISMMILQKIAAKLPDGISVHDENFQSAVVAAESAVNAEGQMAIAELVKRIVTPEAEKTLKIKSSPKGGRIKIAAADGIRYSFGPIWNDSVKAAKGIAIAASNRAKLNHQALLHGIENPEGMNSVDVCQALSQKI
jgi:hypothetical protein